MQVTETLNEGLKRGYTRSRHSGRAGSKGERQAERSAADVEMKGFRKGKVPMALLQKQFGQRLMGEAMQRSHRRRHERAP